MIYKQKLETGNVSEGINTREFIIVHHTGTKQGTIDGVLTNLTQGKVSVHYVVDFNGDIYKIGNTTDILWHCGISEWGKKKNMNRYSIGIEVIGGVGEDFPKSQRQALRGLIQHLMQTFAIPKENVLRHRDIAPGRKIDISDEFWNHGFESWGDYQDSLSL